MVKKNLYKIRERIFKNLFLLSDLAKRISDWLASFSNLIFVFSTLYFIVLFCFYIGFYQKELYKLDITHAFKIAFIAIFFSKVIIEIVTFKKKKIYILLFDLFVFLMGISIIYFNSSIAPINKHIGQLLTGILPLIIFSSIIIISELNKLVKVINSLNIPPTLLFVLSFLLVIIIGSGLLMFPKAHTHHISYLDALFTSTSAVCVTGLVVVDTSTAFTGLGKIIIISLIQIGGLGIMTFTGFFSYIFTGSASFRERIYLKDFLSTENIGNLFKVITKVLLITFLTEIVGAIIIYYNLSDNIENKILFSLFHSISAFCNAGFSTLSQGLSSAEIKTNYNIQFAIATLIILGGIGFPVLLSIYKYVKYIITSVIRKFQQKRTLVFGSTNINTSIVLTSTLALIVIGTVLYYLFEKNTSLSGMSVYQKFVTSFFGSVSARTAGFNVIDISAWSYPTIFFMMFLMWVGASPGSTGGGIKTTTFAIGLRATFSFIRGKKNLEIGNREIGSGTILRVLVIIVLSVAIIFLGFMGLLISEPTKNPTHLLFESFSAFGTVGLSLANTSSLNENSKFIIILLMFIGRIGPLTLLTGIMVSNRKKYYKYPVQDLIIN
ncbi:MAG TPA: ATPase [Bacteroidales bacterium]|nr:ATPase [Bacteroidales bacterium]